MNTLIYILLVAVCVVFIYNIVEYIKRHSGRRFLNSHPLELVVIILLGFVLAGMVMFFFKYLLIPLILLAVIYYFLNRRRH